MFGKLVLLLGVHLQSVPLVDVTRQNGLRLGRIGTVGTLVRSAVLMDLDVGG